MGICHSSLGQQADLQPNNGFLSLRRAGSVGMISSVWAQRPTWPLDPRPNRGRPAHYGWRAPVTLRHIKRWGQRLATRGSSQAAYPTDNPFRSRVFAVVTGSTATTSPSHCNHRRHTTTMASGSSSSGQAEGRTIDDQTYPIQSNLTTSTSGLGSLYPPPLPSLYKV